VKVKEPSLTSFFVVASLFSAKSLSLCGLVSSAAAFATYSDYRNSNQFPFFSFFLQSELLETDNNFGVMRAKRIGSLSIVNNLDVLRQKFLLELARRKALQDQRQIDENRRVLDSIGKRSVSKLYERDSFVKPGTRNDHDWSAASNRFEWVEEAPGSRDDRITKVHFHLRYFFFISDPGNRWRVRSSLALISM